MKLSRLLPILLVLALCLPAAAAKRVIGKLGQVTESTRIYSAMTTRSHEYYSARQFEYLVVFPARSGNWMKVVMQNGQSGFVLADTVARLPYDVTAEVGGRSSGSGMSRSSAAASRYGTALANYSLQFQGTPYVWGGNDPQRGIDCSGFVKQMFGVIGVSLPRTAAEQV